MALFKQTKGEFQISRQNKMPRSQTEELHHFRPKVMPNPVLQVYLKITFIEPQKKL